MFPICRAENGKNNTSISLIDPDICCSFTSGFPGTSLADIFRDILWGRIFQGPLFKEEKIQNPGIFLSLEFSPKLPHGKWQKIPSKNKEMHGIFLWFLRVSDMHSVNTLNMILTTSDYCGSELQSLDDKSLSHHLKWSRLNCIFVVFSGLPCYQKAPTWVKLCLCWYIYTISMQGVMDKRKELKCFVPA